jgi:high affinity sulfate transporter 1
MLTFFTGLFCIAASFLRLGALADFLSKPILVGFLNGIAISILLGQIGKLFGFAIESGGIVPRLLEFIAKLPQTHGPTLAVGLGSFAVLFLARRFLPRWPAALAALVASAIAVALLKLDGHGVAILGSVPAGLPPLRWPTFSPEHLPSLVASAAGLALVLFSSGMLTARSFAAKNRYEIDVDREFAAFGAANLVSALSQGFAVTGADSRTAMCDAAGGRTQVTGLVAAATMAMVLLFLTDPLRYVPIAALGAVLVFASFSLFDVRSLREIWRIDRREVGLAVITTLGVVAVGAIDAILVAVALALVRFVKLTARPRDEVLGKMEGLPGFHSIERHPGAKTFPGLAVYRFNGPITFFNAAYFKQRALAVADAADPALQWFVIDTIPISHIDVTGMLAQIEDLGGNDGTGIQLYGNLMFRVAPAGDPDPCRADAAWNIVFDRNDDAAQEVYGLWVPSNPIPATVYDVEVPPDGPLPMLCFKGDLRENDSCWGFCGDDEYGLASLGPIPLDQGWAGDHSMEFAQDGTVVATIRIAID